MKKLFLIFSTFTVSLLSFDVPEEIQAQIKHPVDICYLVCDLKYNSEQGVKICEIQEVSISLVEAMDYLLQTNGYIQDKFVETITPYQNELFFYKGAVKNQKFVKKFLEQNWHSINSFVQLKKDTHFNDLASRPVHDPNSIHSYHAIFYKRAHQFAPLSELREMYPGIIFMDAACYPFHYDKQKFALLFKGDERLEKLKPKWGCYKKKYSNKLIAQIHEEIDAEAYVIKPIGATRGDGVIIINKEDLKKTLKMIIKDKEKLRKKRDESYKYWYRNHSKTFLVEEFIPSETMLIPKYENKPFDCTMRVNFFLIYNQGTIETPFIAMYWKVPKKSLEERASMNKKHKSYGYEGHFAFVSEEIQEAVQQQLEEGLPYLYMKMLMEEEAF